MGLDNFASPSKLILPFGWVQKQDYTEAPIKERRHRQAPL